MRKRRKKRPQRRQPTKEEYFMKSLLEEIRNARETRDFDYKVGDQTFPITVKRFLPGTAARKRNTSLIKLHQVIQVEAKMLSEMTPEEFEQGIETQNERTVLLNADFCECVIDKETGETYLSVEEAEELFSVDFKTECTDWAMGGAAPPDSDNPTEEEEFHPVHTESEK